MLWRGPYRDLQDLGLGQKPHFLPPQVTRATLDTLAAPKVGWAYSGHFPQAPPDPWMGAPHSH